VTNGGHKQKSTFRNVCNICDDTGWKLTKTGVIRCQCRLEKEKSAKLLKIDERYEFESFETYRKTPVKIFNYADKKRTNSCFPGNFDTRKSYFLSGRGGAGKTHLLWSQYRFCVENGIPAYAENETRKGGLYAKLGEEKHWDVIHFHLTGETHFFIDDIASEKMTEDRSSLLFGLIDTLWDKKASLTMTCNHSLEVIRNEVMLGQNTNRIIRRIKDMCTVVHF